MKSKRCLSVFALSAILLSVSWSARATCTSSNATCSGNTNTGTAFMLALPLSVECLDATVAIMSDISTTAIVQMPTGCAGSGSYAISPCNPVVLTVCNGNMVKSNEFPETKANKAVIIGEANGATPALTAVLLYTGPGEGGDAYLGLTTNNASGWTDYRVLGYTGAAGDSTCGDVVGGKEAFRWLAIARDNNTKFYYTDCAGNSVNSGATLLSQGYSWQLDCGNAATDLSGTDIHADNNAGSPRAFQLISGAESSYIPAATGSPNDGALLEMQLPSSWGGTTLLVAPFQNGGGADVSEVVRLMNVSASAAAITTSGAGVVNINCGTPSFNLAAGATCDFKTTASVAICSDQSIQAMQYHNSYAVDGKGDPTMLNVVPIDKWRCHHRFYTDNSGNYENHVTIMAPYGAIGSGANTYLKLNGSTLSTAGWHTFSLCPNAVVQYYWLDLAAADGVNDGENSVDGYDSSGNPLDVGVVVHGYKTGGNAGMYSYPGGLRY